MHDTMLIECWVHLQGARNGTIVTPTDNRYWLPPRWFQLNCQPFSPIRRVLLQPLRAFLPREMFHQGDDHAIACIPLLLSDDIMDQTPIFSLVAVFICLQSWQRVPHDGNKVSWQYLREFLTILNYVPCSWLNTAKSLSNCQTVTKVHVLRVYRARSFDS